MGPCILRGGIPCILRGGTAKVSFEGGSPGILRMGSSPGILRGWATQVLFLRWDFYVVWFRVVSSFFCGFLFSFSFISACLMVSASNIRPYLYVSFSPSVLIFLELVVLFLLSFVVFFFSLLWNISQWQILSLYLDCISLLPVKILFVIFGEPFDVVHVKRWLIFSYDLCFFNLPVHFLNL